MKHCHSCDRWLPLTAYGKHRGKRDGLATYCKQCSRDHVQASKHRGTDDGLRALHCPRCQGPMTPHASVADLYFCRDPHCGEYDMPKLVRLYLNGARAA